MKESECPVCAVVFAIFLGLFSFNVQFCSKVFSLVDVSLPFAIVSFMMENVNYADAGQPCGQLKGIPDAHSNLFSLPWTHQIEALW